jgi:hypothetical protein
MGWRDVAGLLPQSGVDPVHKRVRLVIALSVSLFTAPVWGQSLSIWPNQFYVFDVENFIEISGGSLGSESTVVSYTNGSTVLNVAPQLDSSAPVLSQVWVPIPVSVTVGRWDVRVIATDVGGAQRVYGPAALDIVERPFEPPPPTLPEVLVVEAGSGAGGTATFDSGGASCDVESGAPLPIGTTTVTCSAGSTTQTFSIVVTDTVPPVLTLPPNIASTDHVVTFTASAIDAIDGAIGVDCTPASGSTFPDGLTVVHCVATDAHANSASGLFAVSVSSTPPVLHLPADIAVEAAGPGGASVTYVATADGGSIQCAPTAGSLFPLGTTTVNCSAMNAAGTSTGSFKVTVLDRTPPTVTSTTPSEATLWPPNHKLRGITVGVMASDLVDPAPSSQIVAVSSNQPQGGDGNDGDASPDWVITGPLTVQLRAERIARLGTRVYTLTVATSDRTGNTTLSTCTVTVPHNN